MTIDIPSPSRRTFIRTGSALTLTGLLGACASGDSAQKSAVEVSDAAASMYGPLPREQFAIPAIDPQKIEPQFYRQEVRYRTNEQPGTVVVDTKAFYLYLVQPKGRAIRYGVGLGRAGFAWSGRALIQWKRKWPTWTPPTEMIARQPELEKYSYKNGGMPPGLKNPLGARALYIFQNGKDTLYRLHGTPEYWSIGKAVSSGCVRLFNHDIIDLYQRVPNKTPIVVV
ncbi:L,D-transpeptidase family protein [Maritalea porphyrae]|uniref:L,D-transpeptidase family protein n=1 Tax=Maritalea porphyrae TaxID=880732 RepID=UPI0022AF994F|nr:L,D-transpeptidase [Maritalea porphyrae]MCZ4273357.1 L,D-transpeptidase [Maritalea porphyrae]